MDFKDRKINLGAGNRIKQEDDFLNHDRWYHRPEIDVAWDLNVFPYPWKDNTFSEIRMIDVLEHLDDAILVMNELHRILQKGCKLTLRLAGEDSKTRWTDPTHRRPYNVDSFNFLDPDRERGKTFNFYSKCRWHIIKNKLDESKAPVFEMTPIK